MSVPRIIVETAWTNDPLDDPATWTTISDSGDSTKLVARAIAYSRGRQNTLNTIEPGSGTILVKDEKGNFDPTNTGGAYYPHVDLWKRFRVRTSTGDPLTDQYLAKSPRKRVGQRYAERELALVDALTLIATPLGGVDYPIEMPGTRMNHVLDTVGFPAGRRNIADGQTELPELVLAATDATTGLSHLQAVDRAESGMIFAGGNGDATLLGRVDIALANTPAAVFSDQPSGAQIGYSDIQPVEDIDLLFSTWTGSRDGGETITVDSGNRKYGYRVRPESSLPMTSDAVVEGFLEWQLGTYATPVQRVQQITVKPGSSSAAWTALIALELGDCITVIEHPPGIAAAQQGDYRIQNLAVQLATPLTASTWTFQLWPVETQALWILEDAVAGYIDDIYAIGY